MRKSHRCGARASLAGVLVVLAAMVLTAMVLTATAIDAQDSGAKISGKVTDPSGAALEGVTVTLTEGQAEASSLRTGADGGYHFVGLRSGAYSLGFSRPGYAREDSDLNLLDDAGMVKNVVLAVLPSTVEQPSAVEEPSSVEKPSTVLKQSKVVMMVDSDAPSVITNQARVSTSTPEGSPGDESAVEETTVTTQADLVITIRDSADPVVAGSALTYTVTVENMGPSHARFVEVTDTLPAGITLDATSGCTEDPRGLPTCSLGTLEAGTTKQFTVEVQVDSDSNGAITNQVSVESETRDIQPGGESASERTWVDAKADLVVTIEDSPKTVVAGGSMTYTVRVTNNGPSDARDVVVRDDLFSQGTSESTTGCQEDPTGLPHCSLGTVPAGTSKQYSVMLLVASDAEASPITNRVNVTTSTAEAQAGDEAAAAETMVETRADLVLTSQDSVDPVIAGRPLTYTVTVANNGPSDARDVAVVGALPAGVTFVSTAGCDEDDKPMGGVANCSLGTIVAGSSKLYEISLHVDPDATGVIANQAIATSATIEDNPGDESAPGR